jgi:hypothetical protein
MLTGSIHDERQRDDCKREAARLKEGPAKEDYAWYRFGPTGEENKSYRRTETAISAEAL